MKKEVYISDKKVLSDSRRNRRESVSSVKQNDSTHIKMEHLMEKVLKDASQRLQAKSDSLQERMDGSPPVEIFRKLSYQQRQYQSAREKLESFINGKEFSLNQLNDIKRSAKIENDAGGSKTNGHILDALSKAIENEEKEHWDLELLNKILEKHKERAKILHEIYRSGSKNIERAKEKTLPRTLVDTHNVLVDNFNKEFQKLVAINDKIEKYNARPEGTLKVEKLDLPERKLEPLNREANSTSWFSSKSEIMHVLRKAALPMLALTSVIDPVYARPTNALEGNGDGFLQEPRYLDHLANLPQNQYKDASWKHMTEPPSLDTSFAPEEPEYHRLVQRENNYCENPPSSTKLVSDTSTAKVYAVGNSDNVSDKAKAVAKAVDAYNAYLADVFGGIKPDDLPFTVYTMSDSDLGIGPLMNEAYHCGCASTTVYVSADKYSPGNVAAEMVEVYEAAINNGWNCGRTNGEALSRVLAKALGHYPHQSSIQLSWGVKGARDYVSTNDADDRNMDANACGTLFLQYLHDNLSYDWKTIVRTGGSTLAETYANLTGNNPTTAFQNFKKALEPFFVGGLLVPPQFGESWASQAEKLKKEVIGGSVGGGLLVLGIAGYIWRRRHQRASVSTDLPMENLLAERM